MQVKLLPENPILFVGEPFHANISVSGKKGKIQWVAAQIVGIVKSLDQSSRECLNSLIIGTNNIHKDVGVFTHVVSGARMIEMDVNIPANYLIKLKSINIPPSYYGHSFEISYTLSILLQEKGKPISTFDFPILIIAPFGKSFDLSKIQLEADFDIDAMKCETKLLYKMNQCPFDQNVATKNETVLLISSENPSDTLSLIFPSSVRQGDLVEITASKGEKCPVSSLIVELILYELNTINGVKEDKVLATETTDLQGALMRKVEFQIPRLLSFFSTEIFSVTYKFRFSGVLPSGQIIQAFKDVSIYPIKISLSSQYDIS